MKNNIDTKKLNDYFLKMIECHNYVDSLKRNKIEANEKTKTEYIKDYLRMQKNETTPLTQSISTNSYYKYRAAWIYSNLMLYNEIYSRAYYENDIENKINLIDQLIECVDRLKQFPPDPFGLNFISAKSGFYESPWNAKDAPPSKTKKYQKLPKNWSIKYFDYIVNKESKYTDAIAIMSLTGCRPAELEEGVMVYLQDDMSFKIKIKSKKTRNGLYGQDFREFNVKSDTIEYLYLLKKLQDNHQIIIKIDKAKAIGEQMRKYSKIVFPQLSDYISPYTYRHYFSKKIKTVLKDKNSIAIALGHSTDQSQRYYSNKSVAVGGFEISNIRGTREVKLTSPINYKSIFNEIDKSKQKMG